MQYHTESFRTLKDEMPYYSLQRGQQSHRTEQVFHSLTQLAEPSIPLFWPSLHPVSCGTLEVCTHAKYELTFSNVQTLNYHRVHSKFVHFKDIFYYCCMGDVVLDEIARSGTSPF